MTKIKDIIFKLFTGLSELLWSYESGLCPRCFSTMTNIETESGTWIVLCGRCGFNFGVYDHPQKEIAAAPPLLLTWEKEKGNLSATLS